MRNDLQLGFGFAGSVKSKRREPMPQWWRDKIAAGNRKPKTAQHRANIARARTGTKRSPETVARMSASQKAIVRVFTAEERARRSERFTGPRNPAFGKVTPHGPRTHWHQYKGVSLRSKYEVRLAKALDERGVKWLYEPERFNLGTCTYAPDFYLPDLDEYWEVKGWMDPRSAEKIRLFQERHPDKALIVADGEILTLLEEAQR